MEKDFKKRVKNLEKKQVEELRALELKYKTKQTSEENRYRLLTEEIEVSFTCCLCWNNLK